MVNFAPAVAFHFCLNLPAAFSQTRNVLIVQPCMYRPSAYANKHTKTPILFTKGTKVRNEVHTMSLDTNTWTTRSPMSGARASHFCAARAREVYVMAGTTGKQGEILHDDVNIFNVDSGEWRIGEFLLSYSLSRHISNLPFVPLKHQNNIKYLWLLLIVSGQKFSMKVSSAATIDYQDSFLVAGGSSNDKIRKWV